MGKTMIINYGVTMEGLANQLLNVVVAHERPDLEAQYAALVSEMSESALLIVQLEDTLLKVRRPVDGVGLGESQRGRLG